jgi:phosphonoacetaldehyde hydrolase
MDFVFKRSYRGPLKAVILDWAGTTMDYGCFAPAVVFVKVYERKDVPISIEQARIPMGAHKKVHIRELSLIEDIAARWQQVHGRKPSEDDVEAMFQDFVPLQLECLADYADLIPGTVEAVAGFRKRGLEIGSSTGYTGEMMELLLDEARKRGYEPDASVCASDVPAGRPHPWMCLENAKKLGVYPMESIVKIGDTLPDIWEGLNAGMWTIGLAKTGNEMGLTLKEIDELDPETCERRLKRAYDRLAQAGAHYVVDAISDVEPLLDEIQTRLSRGDKP